MDCVWEPWQSHQRIKSAVPRVVVLLGDAEYETLAELTHHKRLRAEHIRVDIGEHPGTLVMPPDSAFGNLDVIETPGRPPRRWSVRFDLWTREQGRSDLSVELTLIETDDGQLAMELDDIHVL